MNITLQTHHALAIFVKSPELSPVKTRLAADIGSKAALHCYDLCCQTVAKAVLDPSQRIDSINPYWAIAEAEGLSLERWQSMDRVFQGNGHLGQRLFHVYEQLKNQHRSVILIGADCPTITAENLRQTIDLLNRGCEFVFGPTYDGGFYLFATTCKWLPATIWTSVTYSTSSTLSEFTEALHELGQIQFLEKKHDLDTGSDIIPICEELLRSQRSSMNGGSSRREEEKNRSLGEQGMQHPLELIRDLSQYKLVSD